MDRTGQRRRGGGTDGTVTCRAEVFIIKGGITRDHTQGTQEYCTNIESNKIKQGWIGSVA